MDRQAVLQKTRTALQKTWVVMKLTLKRLWVGTRESFLWLKKICTRERVLTAVALGVGVYAMVVSLGIDQIGAYDHVVTEDQRAEIHERMSTDLFVGFFLPDFLLIFLLITVAVLRRFVGTGLARLGFWLTTTAFLISLFKVSALFGMIASDPGYAATRHLEGTDLRTNDNEQVTTSEVVMTVIPWDDGNWGGSVSGVLTNNSDEPIQLATIDISLINSAGVPCSAVVEVENVDAGESVPFQTQNTGKAKCVSPDPASATATVTTYDVDSSEG